MAKYRINAPDGSVFEVSAPDTATESEVMAYAQAEFAKQKPAIEKPEAVKAGEAIGGIGRQLGLTARYGLRTGLPGRQVKQSQSGNTRLIWPTILGCQNQRAQMSA